jgi:hypothetical protein
MGMNLPIVVYTHTDMKDVWPMFFGQLKKYIGDTKVYVAVNEDDTHLSDYIRIIYDDSMAYTDRWKYILTQIQEDTFMFIHEDMILFDKPKIDYINKYSDLVKSSKVESIKMIYVPATDVVSDVDDTLVLNEYSKLSIQPTILRKDYFKSILDKVGSLNIWDFEKAVHPDTNSYMVKIGGEKKRGIYHCDSIVFPYIATAINKGKWNTAEYASELDKMFMEYGVVPFERGIV